MCLLCQNYSVAFICAMGIHTIPLENTLLESLPNPHVKHCHLHSEWQTVNHWHYEDRDGCAARLPPHFSKCKLFPLRWWTVGPPPLAHANNVMEIELCLWEGLSTHFDTIDKHGHAQREQRVLAKLLQVISIDTRAQMQHNRLKPFIMVYETRFLHFLFARWFLIRCSEWFLMYWYAVSGGFWMSV